MDLNKSQLKTKLNTRLRDGSNLTWSDVEKDDLLSAAIADPYAAIATTDTSITTVANQSTYVCPMESITDLAVDLNGDSYPVSIPRDAYDCFDGNLVFTRAYKGLPAGKTLYITGMLKLDDSATFPYVLQEYVLNLAMGEAYRMLSTTLTSRFVKNDITQAEIMQKISQHAAEAQRLRSQLVNRRLVTL